jgi:hypothetical protein
VKKVPDQYKDEIALKAELRELTERTRELRAELRDMLSPSPKGARLQSWPMGSAPAASDHSRKGARKKR